MCLSDIGTVGTEDGCWVVLICHIVDEDRVPDIRNEREWRTPPDGHRTGITGDSQITYC